MLKEMGVTNNNKCSFCLTAKDTIQHIFWECKHSQQFLTCFLVLLKEKCTSCNILSRSECLILFGIDDIIKTENVFDFILLLAKQYLYKCKIEKQLPIHLQDCLELDVFVCVFFPGYSGFPIHLQDCLFFFPGYSGFSRPSQNPSKKNPWGK